MMMKVEKIKMIKVTIFFSFSLIALFLYLSPANATDLDQVLSGSEVEDVIGNMKTSETSPYIIQHTENLIENNKINPKAEPDFIFNEKFEEISIKENTKKKNYKKKNYFKSK